MPLDPTCTYSCYLLAYPLPLFPALCPLPIASLSLVYTILIGTMLTHNKGTQTNPAIWSTIEPSIGIVSACLPIMGPVLRSRAITEIRSTSWFTPSKSSGTDHHHHHHHHLLGVHPGINSDPKLVTTTTTQTIPISTTTTDAGNDSSLLHEFHTYIHQHHNRIFYTDLKTMTSISSSTTTVITNVGAAPSFVGIEDALKPSMTLKPIRLARKRRKLRYDTTIVQISLSIMP